MAELDFSEFVRRQTARAQSESGDPIDWAKRRGDWLRALEELYTSMQRHLEPYTETREIPIERTPMRLREDHLGTYDASKLTFKIGRKKIVAKPIGTLLIGARGRVDLSGPSKTLKVVLLDKGGPVRATTISHGDLTDVSSRSMVRGEVDEAGWYIETPPPDSVDVAFGEDSFQDAIMDVSDG